MVWGFRRAKVSPVWSLQLRSMSSGSMRTPHVSKIYWLMPARNFPIDVVWSWLGLSRREKVNMASSSEPRRSGRAVHLVTVT